MFTAGIGCWLLAAAVPLEGLVLDLASPGLNAQSAPQLAQRYDREGIKAVNPGWLGKFGIRTYFDANNVALGDPMKLTVEFTGNNLYHRLFAPKIELALDRRYWKVYEPARRVMNNQPVPGDWCGQIKFEYQVRPRQPGIVWIPAIEYVYDEGAGKRTVKSNPVPVHVRPAENQIDLDELAVDAETLPEAPALHGDPGAPLNDELRFAWRKAVAHPSADAFAAFDLVNGKLNEASEAIRAGDWERALGVYRRLEWKIGQTPEIERGIVAALACKSKNPTTELPAWRQLGRPILRHAWAGRCGIVGGAALALAVLWWLLGKAIRRLALWLLAALLLVPSAGMAQFRLGGLFDDPFFSTGRQVAPPKITVRLETERAQATIGEDCAFVLSLEMPKTTDLGRIQIDPTRPEILIMDKTAEMLTDAPAKEKDFVRKRIRLRGRWNAVYNGQLAFTVRGMATTTHTEKSARGNFTSSYSSSVNLTSSSVWVRISPLAKKGQPQDFSGAVSPWVKFRESPDMTKVESNDVITVTYTLQHDGFVPAEYAPPDVAFEWSRDAKSVSWKRYVIADGIGSTPQFTFTYYEPMSRTYKRVTVGGSHVEYR